eukprot:2608013-Prymnesium_polylepis.3
MATPVSMVREDGGPEDEEYKQKYCGAGKYIILRTPTDKEVELAQATWDEVEAGKCCINDAELSLGKKCGLSCTTIPNCFPQARDAAARRAAHLLRHGQDRDARVLGPLPGHRLRRRPSRRAAAVLVRGQRDHGRPARAVNQS